MHETVDKIRHLLEAQSIPYEYFEHAPVRTSEEAAAIRKSYSLSQGAKALILRIKKTKTDKFFVMLVLPGDKQFDKNKIKELFDCKDVRFATEDEVAEITNGIMPGGVPPFGNLFGLKVYADPLLKQNQKIIFNAGDKRASIAMGIEDYTRVVQPQFGDLV